MNSEPAKPREDRLIGRQLASKYRIIQKIGEGGMGSVYIATDETLDRKVAIKVLLGRLAEDEVAVKRFAQEARAISKMQHPNTVTIYEFGEIPGSEQEERRLYIAMEYLRGRTLTQLLRAEGVLAPLRASRILRQVCASLAEAHAVGIIHRDLKPDNIFLTEVGADRDWVKVLDFGVAKLANAESAGTLTQTGMIFGTPKYMSPEQAEGRPIDYRADIYALGVVLYELLVGRPPFLAETPVGLLLKHISEPPPSFKKTRPDITIPPVLEAIAMRALSKQPADRPSMVSELAAELERFERDASGGHLIPSPGTASEPAQDGLALGLPANRPGLPTELIPGSPGGGRTPVPPSRVPSSLSLGGLAEPRTRRPSTTLPEDILPTTEGEALRAATRATASILTPDGETGELPQDAEPSGRAARGLLMGGALALAAALGLAVFAIESRERPKAEPLERVAESASDTPALAMDSPVGDPGKVNTTELTAVALPEQVGDDGETGVDAPERTDESEAPEGSVPRTKARPRAPVRPTAPVASLVRFHFRSTPEGALVILGGQEIGRTPFSRDFPRDSKAVRLVVRKDGYGEKLVTRTPSRDQEIALELTREARRSPAPRREVCPDGTSPPCTDQTSMRTDPLREKVGDLK